MFMPCQQGFLPVAVTDEQSIDRSIGIELVQRRGHLVGSAQVAEKIVDDGDFHPEDPFPSLACRNRLRL